MRTYCSYCVLSLSILLMACTQKNNKYNEQLANQLDSILRKDQLYRTKIDSLEQNFGDTSKIVRETWDKINQIDSLNLVQVMTIIDKYGWLGSDIVGKNGNLALFFVIQHSPVDTQEKYLPIMQKAVKNGNANGSEFALLVDRVEMFRRRPQIYGSQIQMIDNKYTIYPIIDEINVNKRRAEVGLQPLEEYVKHWKIEYKLPTK